MWLYYWLDLICSIVAILSFSYYRPDWDMLFSIWFTKRILKKKISIEEKIKKMKQNYRKKISIRLWK